MRIVMAFGTFDCIHPGHIYYLKKAKSLGDELVVVVARDRNVQSIKGRKASTSEKDRLETVQSLRFVDKAVLGDREMRKWGVIKRFHPVAIALGYDQWASIPPLREELEAAGLRPRIVRIGSYNEHKNSASKLLKKHAKK
ncbi:MAG: FAD synthase [Candidatus Diapherotrites archaeon]|nr:FAD synthase [Candidatus Diapherotrites archaeon]